MGQDGRRRETTFVFDPVGHENALTDGLCWMDPDIDKDALTKRYRSERV